MNPMPDAADLAAHQRFVRALARNLVADAAAADDLAQDAWVAALAGGPRTGGSVRAWFATVLRRRAAETRRERASRDRREAISARGEALPSTLDMVERAAVQRDLVQAVLDLEEPYRTTILWRFFEELPPREIARRAGAPVATVHSRIARGLAQLRARLDRDKGGARSWMLALAPLVRTPTTGPWWTGALAMKSATKVAIAAALLAVTVVLWKTIETDETAATHESPAVIETTRAEPRKESGPAVDSPETGRSERTAAANAARGKPAAEPAVVAAPARTIRGEVLDSTGHRLGDVALRFAPASQGAREPFRSDSTGRFEIALPAGAEQVLSADARWATVLGGSARMAPETLSIVVVAPRIDLGGIVVDEDGAPLLGAELSVHVPQAFGSSFARPLDASANRAWSAVSDAQGRFALPDLPSVDDAVLRVALGGFETSIEALPAASDPALRIVLRRPRAPTGRLTGIVVDPAGALVQGARVSAGFETTISDEAGRFEIDVAKEPAPKRVTAAKRGFLPALLEPDPSAAGKSSWPDHVVLRLGGEPRGIEGRVLDGEGAPVSGARVWLDDPTYFGMVENEPVQVETLLGRADAKFWAYVPTDADGAFRIDGVLERTYRLRAMDPKTLLAATSEPVEAGSRGVEIRLPRNALHEKVTGQVVARDGTPMANLAVVVERFGFQVEYPTGGTRDEWLPRAEVRTDAEGRFTVRDVPRENVEILVRGETILAQGVEMKEGIDVEDLEIVVSRRMHLQVELDAPVDRADEMRVLDGEGNAMLLRIMRNETSFTNRKAEIVDGRSQVLSLAEDGRTVVLFKAGAEVARLPIALRADELTTARF